MPNKYFFTVTEKTTTEKSNTDEVYMEVGEINLVEESTSCTSLKGWSATFSFNNEFAEEKFGVMPDKGDLKLFLTEKWTFLSDFCIDIEEDAIKEGATPVLAEKDVALTASPLTPSCHVFIKDTPNTLNEKILFNNVYSDIDQEDLILKVPQVLFEEDSSDKEKFSDAAVASFDLGKTSFDAPASLMTFSQGELEKPSNADNGDPDSFEINESQTDESNLTLNLKGMPTNRLEFTQQSSSSLIDTNSSQKKELDNSVKIHSRGVYPLPVSVFMIAVLDFAAVNVAAIKSAVPHVLIVTAGKITIGGASIACPYLGIALLALALATLVYQYYQNNKSIEGSVANKINGLFSAKCPGLFSAASSKQNIL